jgi:putative FmdB family regulatory protein
MPQYIYECDNCMMRFPEIHSMNDKPDIATCPKCKSRAEFHMGATMNTQRHTGNHWKNTGGFDGNGEEGSLSRAVMPDQVPEQMAEDKRLGVDHLVTYKEDRKGFARPCFRSKIARDKYDKAHGFYDRS